MDIYIDINQPLSPLYSSEARQSTIRSLTLKRGNESIINVNIIGTPTISWHRTKLTIKRLGRYDDPPVIDGYCDGAGGAIKILAESQALRDDLGVGKGRDIPQAHYIGEIAIETTGSNPRRLACKTFDVVVQNNVERGEDAPVDPPRPNYPPADQVATKADMMPAGGTAGQVLAKVDDVDRNAGWIDPPAGGSASRKRLVLMATNEATPRGDGTYDIVLANGNLNFDLDHLAGGVTPADIDYIEEIDLVLKIPDMHVFDGNTLNGVIVDIQRIKKDFAQDIDNPKQMIVNIIFESLSLIKGSKKSIGLSGWTSVGESKFIYMGGATLQRYMLSRPSSSYTPMATLLAQEADTSAHIIAEHNTSNVAHPDIRQQVTSLVKASVPIGGTAGQVLTKASAANNDVGWVDPQAGGGGDVDGAIAAHNTSTSSHTDLRNSLVPQSGMVGQVLVKWGINASQHRWETAPWATTAQNDTRYMSSKLEAESLGIRLKSGSHIMLEPSVNNTNYRIVNKHGVLGYQPFNVGQSGTDYVGFVPFGGGSGGIEFAQYNYNDLKSNMPKINKGSYRINLTYFYKSSSNTGCIPNNGYQSQLQYLRPFEAGSVYKAYNATISVIDAPSPSGQFHRQGGPLTFSVKDLIDPNDIAASKLIVNPGDYIDHVCAQNKDPFTGYSYINIELLLDCTTDNANLFGGSWLDHVGTYYTPFVNLVITKL